MCSIVTSITNIPFQRQRHSNSENEKYNEESGGDDDWFALLRPQIRNNSDVNFALELFQK